MRWLALASSAITGLIVGGVIALAAAPGVINQYNAVCDANFPSRCLGVDSNGAIAVTGGGGGGGGSAELKATAADPTYVEGSTTNPLSADLSGHMRVLAKQQTSPWVVSGTVGVSGGVGVTQVTSPWVISGGVSHAAGSAVDGWDLTQGVKTDAKIAATDGTPASIVSILKQLSFMMQNPATTPVTGTVGVSGGVAATQSGAWNVGQVGSPWGVTGTGAAGTPASGVVSIQGIAGAVALPASQSGAWTVGQTGGPWTMTGSGAAGSPAAGVLTVQGSASGTPIPVSASIAPATAVAAVASTGLETGKVLKSSPGTLYGVEATTTSVAGYLLVFNLTAVPAAGAVSPVAHCYVAAFATCGLNFDPPLALSVGISVAFSASSTPFTKTDSATAAFSGQIN